MARLPTLRHSRDFQRVLASGVRRRVKGVTVISSTPAGSTAAVGFVVGKPVGTAVERNRAKRRLRAAVAAVPGFLDEDRVVIAGRGVLTASFEVLVSWLRTAISNDD